MREGSPSPNWLQLKKDLEREHYRISSQPGDLESMLDLDYALKHPGEVGTALEVREKRKKMEAEILTNAAKMEAEVREAKERAKKEALEAAALAAAEHIAISIDGQQVRFKKWDQLKCPKCGAPSMRARDLAQNAAEFYIHSADHVRAGRISPHYNVANEKCPKCGKGPYSIRVQTVIM